jgi:hypothetical protein
MKLHRATRTALVCGCLAAAALAQTQARAQAPAQTPARIQAPAQTQDLYLLPGRPGEVQSRASTAENPNGRKGQGGQSNAGAKGNAAISLKAGESRELLKVGGAGMVTRIWLTINDRSPAMLGGLKLRMYWDGSATPAVDVPLGDFFCAALGRPVAFESALFSDPEGRSLVCIIPMPFRKGAKIIVSNEAGIDLAMLFYEVDFIEQPAGHTGGAAARTVTPDALYFHAHWHRQRQTPIGQDLELLPKVQGRGRFLGVSIGVNVDSVYGPTWWGEGEVKMYLDGDSTYPTINGTGTEDYIGTGWGEGTFAHQYQGCLVADGKGHQYVFYRFHVPDPVWFDQDCRVTLQEIGGGPADQVKKLLVAGVPLKPVSVASLFLLGPAAPKGALALAAPNDWTNFYRSDDYAVTAYYYLDRP